MADGNVMNSVATTVQVVSVVVGVVISILSFNHAREKDAEARKLEATKPFLELRQKLYTEAVKVAAVLSNPGTHSEEEIQAARKRFRDLYVTELSMVEAPGVEAEMKAFAAEVDKELLALTPAQGAAYNLAHALRDSYVASYQFPR
jgi:hypothetical protein